MRSRKLLATAALLAATLQTAAIADNLDTPERGVRQSLRVVAEGINTNGIDAERFQATKNFQWEVGNRSKIEFNLPWQSIDTRSGGTDAKASGLMDASLNFTFAVRDLAREGSSSRWELRTNIPIGKDGLNANEFTAVNRLTSASQGFLNPQFGRGFGGGLRHYWQRVQGDVKQEFFVGFNLESSYDLTSIPGNQIRSEGYNSYDVGFLRQWSRQNNHWGVNGVANFYGDSANTVNGNRTEIDSDPSFLIRMSLDQHLTPVSSTHFELGYQFRDRQDILSPGIPVGAGTTDLGDRVSYQALYLRHTTPDESWKFGVVGLTSFENQVNGVNVANSRARETFGRIGYRRETTRGLDFELNLDLGLNSASRDYVVGAALTRSF